MEERGRVIIRDEGVQPIAITMLMVSKPYASSVRTVPLHHWRRVSVYILSDLHAQWSMR